MQRAINGQAPERLTRAERLEVTRRLLASGDGASQVARVLSVSGSTAAQLVEQVAS